ncbi:MAG: glycosyltransferase family 4 protein [Coriobacteriia bacterium]|nr:glycosyltransferase family 4 protein [Coriobacteriia bacterium]MBN2840853.1 glycosyltransferase family 4 protein [Coriobacteriia bacterium]
MRVLYLHQFFATRESSLGLIRSYEFSRRMVENGHDVTMVTSSSRLPESYGHRLFTDGEIDGIRVRSVRVRYANVMGFARRIWSFLAFTVGATWLSVSAGRHDVVVATSTPLTVGIPGWIAAALSNTPFVFEVRDLWPEAAIQMGALTRGGLLARFAKALERFLYRRAVSVIALSPGMVAGVLGEGIDAARVHMIPNCSDLDLFHPGEKDRELVDRFQLDGLFVVGYAGAVGPSNALEAQLPEAARILEERGRSDIVFVVAGEGKSLPELERLTADRANVRLVGLLPKREVPRLTRTADVLLTLFAGVPILATNSPNKFFDALASGRPVIVNQPGWTRDLVEDNAAGVAVPAGDGRALADAIQALADDPERTALMGRNARRLAEDQFDRDVQAIRFMSVLEDAARARR